MYSFELTLGTMFALSFVWGYYTQVRGLSKYIAALGGLILGGLLLIVVLLNGGWK